MANKKTRTDEKIPEAIRAKRRADGWQNTLTGLGVQNKDKRLAGQMVFDKPLGEREVEDIYAADGQARRLVDILPGEATRQWLEFENIDDQTAINDEIDRLKIKTKTKEAWTYARVYGGGGLFINTGDAPDVLKEPLDERTIRKLISVVPLTRYELQVWPTDINGDLTSENFGKPEIYRLVIRRGASGTTAYLPVHHTRIIRFDGLFLPRILSYQNQLWGDSVFTPVHEVLRDYGVSYGSVANILHDFRILVYKIADLQEMVDSEDLDRLKTRLEAMNLSRSVIGAFMLDTEEQMEYFSSPVAGVGELLDKMKQRLQAAVDIPHTILFNESPSGLGATGRSEETQWYDYVKSQQETYLAPILDRIFKIMFLGKQGPTRGVEPAGWKYKFCPLWQATEQEAANLRKTKAETSKIFIENGEISVDEAREMDFPDLEGPAPEPPEPPEPQIPQLLSAAGLNQNNPALPGTGGKSAEAASAGQE